MPHNLVLVVADQLRADYLGCYGNSRIHTHNIDALASEGVSFSSMYCASPLCGPSRISLVTSTYVGEHGHRNYGSTISPDVPNLVMELKKAGLRTAMFGKNHMFTIRRLGEVWDELDEICLGNYDGHPSYVHSFSSFEMEKDNAYNISGRLTDEAVDFIHRTDVPFLLMVNYQDPHPAYTCPEPYYSMFDRSDIELPATYYDRGGQPRRCSVWRAHSEMDICSESDMKNAIATYMGQIRYVDDCLGRIVRSVREKGLWDDTVFVFMSDHGELLGSYGMTHKIPVFYDCLTRIPFIIRIPGMEKTGYVQSGLAEEVDIAPTILEAFNCPVPASMVGKSMYSCIMQGKAFCKDSILCEAGGGSATVRSPVEGLKLKAPFIPTSFGPGAMVRKGKYKLSFYSDDMPQLFDLEKDQNETENLFDDESCASVRREMTELLLRRLLSENVREIGPVRWPKELPPGRDLRFEPLEGDEK